MQRGFKITNILMDGKFACIRGDLVELQINLNICSNDKHMGEIDQLNCTVKEQFRGNYKMLPFKKLPGRMVVELVALVIFCLKALPPSPYVGGNLIPCHIIAGLAIKYAKQCCLQFGKYSQVQESHDKTIQEQTTGDIALWPTGNAQGAYFFMSLANDRKLNCQSFTPLPLPQDVIGGVHPLARHNIRGLEILERDPRPFLKPEHGADNDDDDSTSAPLDDNNSDN